MTATTDNLPLTEHPAFDEWLSDPEHDYFVLKFATRDEADEFYATVGAYGFDTWTLGHRAYDTDTPWHVEIGHDDDGYDEPPRRIRRRGDDIPSISDYSHWNEDAAAMWYAENRYDMEHADEIIEEDW